MRDINFYKGIIFSDVDGVFASREMDFLQSRNSFVELEREKVLLVLASSKSLSSMKRIIRECRVDYPFIFENGGGIRLPKNFPRVKEEVVLESERVISLADKLENVKKIFIRFLQRFDNLSIFFPDMPTDFEKKVDIYKKFFPYWSIDEIKENVFTKKYYDLAFQFENEPKLAEINNFFNLLQKSGIKVFRAGLFFHALKDSDKGKAVEIFTNIFLSYRENSKIFTVSIGDGENDIPMLLKTNYSFFVYSGSSKTKKPSNLDKKIKIISRDEIIPLSNVLKLLDNHRSLL